LGAVLAALVALFLPSHFGLAEVDQIKPQEVAASRYIYENGRQGGILLLAAPNFPMRASADYDRFRIRNGPYDPNLMDSPQLRNRLLGEDDLPAIEATARYYENSGKPVYLVISSGMKAYCHLFTLLPDGSLDSLDRALATSERWRVFYRNDDAVVYELLDQPPESQSPAPPLAGPAADESVRLQRTPAPAKDA
jgi:hypothetical protein